MKTPFPKQVQIPSNRRAAALITVLALLVIIVVAVVSLAQLATSERRASSSGKAIFTNEALADMAVNIVLGQIRTGTTQPADIAWASQPGLIRTVSGNQTLQSAYKLYSSTRLVATGQVQLDADLAIEASPANSANRTAIWCDLNAPVTVPETDPAQPAKTSYPIIDPRALGKVEGFTYNGSNSTVAAIPMPVQWMYVLSDGTVVAPDPAAGDGKTVTLTGASKDNPPVGRIAFWTDDESCKLNVNTASYGTYWDAPFVGENGLWQYTSDGVRDIDDYLLAINQPAQREYQRYPGHPATTSLGPVFRNYLGQTEASLHQTLVNLSPKYRFGGSEGGTKVPASSVSSRDERLYSTPDEYRIAPDRNTSTSPNNILSDDMIQQTRFFLTASSRAPEVNLFNMPKISIWPVSSNNGTTNRTPYDEATLFCSSIGNSTDSNLRYAFTRSSPNAANGELAGRNLDLYNYLAALTKKPVPGFGSGTFQRYGTDRLQILTEIYDFIRSTNLVDQSTSVTGFNVFTVKPTTIRTGTANEEAISTPGSGQVIPTQYSGTRGFGRFAVISEASLMIMPETDPATPDDPATTRDNESTKYRAVFLMELSTVAQGNNPYHPNFQIRVTGLDRFSVRPKGTPGNTWTSLFPGAGGPTTLTANVSITAGGASQRAACGSLGIASTLFGGVNPSNGDAYVRGLTNGGPAYPFVGSLFSKIIEPPAPAPVVNNTFEVTTNQIDPATKQLISPAAPQTITVEILDAAGAVVQTYNLPFPDLATAYPDFFAPTNTVQSGSANTFKTWAGRLNRVQQLDEWWHMNAPLAPSDVILSLVPGNPTSGSQGDLRLLAIQDTVGDFQSLPVNTHGLAGGRGLYPYGFGANNVGDKALAKTWASFGKLVKDAKYWKDSIYGGANPRRGDLAPLVNGVVNSKGKPGDFSTGIGDAGDGPWIGKADEGDFFNQSANYIPYYGRSSSRVIGETLFSPNRMIASAMQFGSLSSGAKAGHAWETLLFCPNPAAVETNADRFSSSAHPGFADPPDHLLADLFWMPVVEPYVISDPFATAGKVNLNYRMVPFGNIERSTALRGVLEPVKITAIPFANAAGYKASTTTLATTGATWADFYNTSNMRLPLDLDATVTEIKRKFAGNGAYISATQICEVFLIPKAGTRTPAVPAGLDKDTIIPNFWVPNRLTGDNLRERPYALLYPRLTTKSNVFTTHYTVQALKKIPSSDQAGWDETRDVVAGEQRGSVTVERYIDPNDAELKTAAYNFAAQAGSASPPTLGRFYKFRTISNTQFRP